jgi:hypothetical protein
MNQKKLIQQMSIILIIAIPFAIGCSDDGFWREEFNISSKKFTHTGKSKYFVLKPGFQLVLESKTKHLIITVLDEIKEINGIETRVVEERELKNGNLYEISRNFFAIDLDSNHVYYFGEDVDYYKGGKVDHHAGEWLAYKDHAKPGMFLPNIAKVGMKFYQEMAPDIAMDRAEVVSVTETYSTPAGDFNDVLLIHESSKMKPYKIESKYFAPGVGILNDGKMRLISYGFIKEN